MTELQREFSRIYPNAAAVASVRARKAHKVLAVLRHYGAILANSRVLEIGCSAGFGTVHFAQTAHYVWAIDVDVPALRVAATTNACSNISYIVMDAGNLAFPAQLFDIVICSHVYEHVPSPERLMAEIHRVLKPGGICYFAAGNRLQWMEPHYRIPLLSVIPKRLAHLYLRILGRGTRYYENHLTYWALKKLVSRFSVVDYTRAIVENPNQFAGSDVLVPGSLKQQLARSILSIAYWICPTYVWILIAPTSPSQEGQRR